MKLYKVLDADGSAFHGGIGKWHLPKGKRPGKWMPPIEGKLVPCLNGYHLCREKDLPLWLGPAIWEAGGRGECVECDDKMVFREARLLRKLETWNDRTARLFACDCAERALARVANPGPRSLKAVEVSRRFANGDATEEELAAAGDAARAAAAWATARDVAWAAARAATRNAWAAAWAAARAAARDVAWAAEREWQAERLMWYLDGEVK